MVTKLKTKGVRLCESSVLGKTHKKILSDFDKEVSSEFLKDEDILGYTIDIYYDKKSKMGFYLVSYKIFHEDLSTSLIRERLVKLEEEESFLYIKKEYELFIRS